MHVGDKWWYWVDNGIGQPQVQLFRHVYADTMINGNRLYKVSGISGSQSTYWIYNEGDSTFVYDQADADNNPLTEYLLNENFGFSIPSDSCLTYRTIGGLNPLIPTWIYLFNSPIYANVFGEIQLNKTIVYVPQSIPLIQYIQWSRKFGPVYMSSEFLSFTLAACIIDSIFYGDPSVNNSDELAESYIGVGTTIYPNPFHEYVNIKFNGIANGSYITVSFYNIKGQLIKSTKYRDDVVKIKTSDFLSLSCSSGIYFCNIQNDFGYSKTTKLIYLH